jgi:hypothetical protein
MKFGLLLLDLCTYAIDLFQLRHVALDELHAAVRIQCFAFVDDTLGGRGIAAHDVDMRGDGILYEGFGSILSNS